MRIFVGALVAVAFLCAGPLACNDPRDLDLDGFTEEEGDCDDADPAANPAAIEIPGDGVDQRCNGPGDEDQDRDGFSLDGTVGDAGDCNDASATVFPGATEIHDGFDQNCDGVPDDHTETSDDDGDGFSEAEGDCNDENAFIAPLVPEEVDSVDNDCDYVVDEGTSVYDDDEDEWNEEQGDCDDTNKAVYPFAAETGPNVGLGDTLDNDCDGVIDEGTWSFDDDGDGFTELGDPGDVMKQIPAEPGDCDDSDPLVRPGVPEIPGDGIDNNCDQIFD